MTSAKLKDIREQYKQRVKKAREKFENDVLECLEAYNLHKKVVRKKDGKIGWLAFNDSGTLCFYPRKKDGLTSINSSGWFFLENVVNEFEPYKEDEE